MTDIAKAAADCACGSCKEFDARPDAFMRKAVVETRYELGYSALFDLRQACAKHGGGEAELSAIDRFEHFEATGVDVERLAPLAYLAGLPWEKMFPRVGGPVAHSANDFAAPASARCPHCGELARAGEITCGRVSCREHGAHV